MEQTINKEQLEIARQFPDITIRPEFDPKKERAYPEVFTHASYRFFEMLPGLVVWFALISPFVLSIYYPLIVSVFIIMFDVYWLMTSISYGRTLIIGYRRLRKSLTTNWMAKLIQLEKYSPDELIEKNIIDWREIYHVVIMTTYQGEQEMLDAGIKSIVESNYPKNKIIFILACEGRAPENPHVIGPILKAKYGHNFNRFIITEHPDGILGEIKAKGANATWAAKILVKQMIEENIQFDHIIVSTADEDARFEKQYFSNLTYKYINAPDRTNCGYQPISMYSNNIWEAPALSRVLAFGTTFWSIIQSVREYRLVTFATHAMSLKTLVDMDFWCRTIVNEDSRQFYRAFFHYRGKFRSIPMYMPVYMDAVSVGNFWKTMRNLYLQQERWAYGMEHFPYIVMASLKYKNIPWISRIALIWRTWQGGFSWATTSFFITVVGWLPIYLNKGFHDQVIASNFPIVTKSLLSLTWIGLVISGSITIFILPERPKNKNLLHSFAMVGQWLLVPITTMFFGALPGIVAQTRLLLGKHIGFRVTEKKIINN